MTESRCIWCLSPTTCGHKEHIIPEALGCPDGFVLPGSIVCKKCNNGLAHLDQAVIDEFDFLSFMASIPRKRGRSPVIKSRGNVLATMEASGPTYSFNMEPHPVTAHDGKLLSPFRGARRNIRFFFKKDDHKASVSFKVNFGQGPKFARGLFKIALSSLAYFLGPTVALSHQFNTVREFVRHGRGKDTRYVMHKFADDRKYLNQAWPPYTSQSGDYVCIFRIAMSEFLVDLSDSQSYLAVLMENADNLYTQDKWFLLPPKR